MNRRLAALAVWLTPLVALAQDNKIERNIMGKALPWAVGIAVAIGALGIVRAAIKYNSGEADAKETAQNAGIGIVLALSAGGLVALLRTWFG